MLNIMKTHADFSRRKRYFRWYSLFPSIMILILAFSSCTSHPEPYSILEFSGKADIYNYSRSLFPILFESDSINSTALLANKGDIIVYGENSCFYYSGESSQKNFSINIINDESYINEKISSITIPSDDAMIPWFNRMKFIDISSLGFLYFDSVINENYIPYLTDLSVNKPDVGLGYDGDFKDLARILEIFNPAFIVGTELYQEDFDLLAGLKNLEALSVSLGDSIYSNSLPAMPKLKQLILADVNNNSIIGDDFLINNKQIERLTIMESDKFDLLLIEPLVNLKELIINGTDTIENFNLLTNHKQIELLSVNDEKFNNDGSLRELPGIRWMTFYEDATQDGFNTFIGSHPDVEVVEIIQNDLILQLQALLKLRKLYGLTITDTLTDLTTVISLKTLKYLSLPYNTLNDSIIKTQLQKSLPDTRIVPNHGVCLGSGWLLLIIPLILVFRVFVKQKFSKVK
jgi:hypothetical protein